MNFIHRAVTGQKHRANIFRDTLIFGVSEFVEVTDKQILLCLKYAASFILFIQGQSESICITFAYIYWYIHM